jgi:hypothetical protein
MLLFTFVVVAIVDVVGFTLLILQTKQTRPKHRSQVFSHTKFH